MSIGVDSPALRPRARNPTRTPPSPQPLTPAVSCPPRHLPCAAHGTAQKAGCVWSASMRDGDKLEAWAEPGLDIPGTCSHGLRGTQAEILGVFQTLCLRVQWPLKTVYNPYTQGRESACKVLGGSMPMRHRCPAQGVTTHRYIHNHKHKCLSYPAPHRYRVGLRDSLRDTCVMTHEASGKTKIEVVPGWNCLLPRVSVKILHVHLLKWCCSSCSSCACLRPSSMLWLCTGPCV